ncbi:hypothetical protein GE21DRAFT_1352773, partial [Neurospora crassa]
MASWRNGSAFDSRSKGYPFKSGWGHLHVLFNAHNVLHSGYQKVSTYFWVPHIRSVGGRPGLLKMLT